MGWLEGPLWGLGERVEGLKSLKVLGLSANRRSTESMTPIFAKKGTQICWDLGGFAQIICLLLGFWVLG